MLFLLTSQAGWVVQLATDSQIQSVASMCIEEFETLQMPLFPLPGWEERARTEAIAQWSASRKALLADSNAPHALLVVTRDEAEAGRYIEGVGEDGVLGFAELGVLPAPPEKP